MSIEIKNFEEYSKDKQYEIASLTSLYTNGFTEEKPQMLPLTIDDVLNKFKINIAENDGKFCGIISADHSVGHNDLLMHEVGGLWVPAPFRGKGIGDILIKSISAQILDENRVTYAFCNILSLGIFQSAGYQLANEHELPNSAFELCNKCPCKPQIGCCDTPVIFKGEKNE